MSLFEHPLQLFVVEYPDEWEMRYQEETGGAIFVYAHLEKASAFSLTPLAVTGPDGALSEEVARIAERLGVALHPDTLREEEQADARIAYGEGSRESMAEAGPLAAGSNFRFWVLRHGTLALHAAQLGPGVDDPEQREAADAMLRSLRFPEVLPPTPEEFRRRVMETLGREYTQVHAVSTGEWGIDLAQQDGAPIGTLGLENLYRSCLLSAESAGALIREYLDQVLGSFADTSGYDRYDAVRERLLPMLKSEEWVRDLPGGLDLLQVEFAPGLVVCFAIDEPSRVAYVTREMLEKWDMPLERIQGVALDNLSARQDGLEMTVLNGEDGRPFALVMNTGDGYDATRLVLPRVRDTLAEELGEEYLVGIPNRDFLIAFSSRSAEMSAGIVRQVRQDYHKMHHPLSPEIYRVRADSIELMESE